MVFIVSIPVYGYAGNSNLKDVRLSFDEIQCGGGLVHSSLLPLAGETKFLEIPAVTHLYIEDDFFNKPFNDAVVFQYYRENSRIDKASNTHNFKFTLIAYFRKFFIGQVSENTENNYLKIRDDLADKLGKDGMKISGDRYEWTYMQPKGDKLSVLLFHDNLGKGALAAVQVTCFNNYIRILKKRIKSEKEMKKRNLFDSNSR